MGLKKWFNSQEHILLLQRTLSVPASTWELARDLTTSSGPPQAPGTNIAKIHNNYIKNKCFKSRRKTDTITLNITVDIISTVNLMRPRVTWS